MVTLYTKPNCPDCVFMKQYLTYKKIDYTEQDIFSEEFMQVIKPTGFMTAPLIKIGEKIMPASRARVSHVADELRLYTAEAQESSHE